MSEQIVGKVFDIQGFSVHDGPGIRLTVFLKGCPLRCPWCHSPESLEFHTELNWMGINCLGTQKCGRCLDACPHGLIAHGDTSVSTATCEDITLIKIDRSSCLNCGKCAKVCPPKALYMCGTDYTVDEIMQRVKREKPFFNKSGGGITISGGECLYQPEFVRALLKCCKAEGIHTAVDTTGLVKWDIIESILPYTDLFLYDIKGIDSDLHEKVVGKPNALILENARKIAAAGGKFQIRVPILPMYTDSKAVIDDIGKFILELGDAVELVQLLPYHNLGTVKWERLHKNAPVFEATPPTPESLEAHKKQLENMGIHVTIH
ncbi:MAG: glycyl-radical enzyme activating protein [Oscillospiraceae bacterium]|nr:glycyl-radical enzyme activating protein [Oscillospiraceae bacterium]